MKAWTLAARPKGLPTSDDFALVEQSLPDLAEGQVRVVNRWLSVDPYMRGRMNDTKSYVPPFQLGEPMQGGAIGEVVESRADGIPVGTLVSHMAGWRDEAVLPAQHVQPLPDIKADPQAFLGQLGMPGMTAYYGLLHVAEAKPGDTVFVSAAAGAVGSTVVQIAKAKGMTVIGSAGGADKTEWVRQLGADAVIDYKGDTPVVEALGQAAPDVIDVYFDNVGGDHLDAALAHAKPGARFAICGMIDVYNDAKPTSLKYLFRLIGNRIRMQGFIVSDFKDQAGFYRDMAAMLADGKLQREETVFEGLEKTPEAFLALFSGGNKGKMGSIKRASDRTGKSVALGRIARLHAPAQPAHPLLRGAMGEAVGHHPSGRLALERIVANGASGGHAFLDIAGLQPIAILRGPDAGIAIGLQFQPDGQGIALRLACRLLCAADLIRGAEQVLDVMAELVRDDIIAREVALRAEPVGEFIEEAGVEINAIIGWAIEGAHGRLRRAAARLARSAKEAQARGREALPGFGEDLFPGVLGVAERLAGFSALG